MNLVSIPVIMMSAICFYVGLYHIWLFIRRRAVKENLTFALTCFIVALYDFFCAGKYNTSSLEVGIFWQRLQISSLPIFALSFGWFVQHITNFASEKLLYKRLLNTFTVVIIVFFFLGLFAGNELTLSIGNPLVKHVKMGFIEVIYYEASPGLIFTVEYIMMLFWFAVMLIILVKYYMTYRPKHFNALFIAIFIFFFGALNDILISFRVYSFIYLFEYTFMLIILSMGYLLVNRFVDLYDEVHVLNINLEEKVANRTKQLTDSNKKLYQSKEEFEVAMEELEAINKVIVATNEELEVAKMAAETDMKMAVHVQTTMFPKGSQENRDWDIAYTFKPVFGVSGDLYDFYIMDGNLEGVALFDVSGHGISSGLITLLAKSIIFRRFRDMKDFRLDQVIEIIDNDLRNEIGNVEKYLTGILLRFNNGNVEYVNAGHVDLIHKESKKNRVSVVRPEGRRIQSIILGQPDVEGKYRVIDFGIEKGDSLFLCTDALHESINGNNEAYRLENVLKSLKQAPDGSAVEILDYIMRDFYRFIGPGELTDDLTAILLKKR